MAIPDYTESGPAAIGLYFDDKNYSGEQAQSLAQTFRDHGYRVATGVQVRKSLGLLPGAITLASALPLGRILELFFEQAYDAWVRPALANTLFKARNKNDSPWLEIHGENAHVYLIVSEQTELDRAVDELRALFGVLEDSDLTTGATSQTLRLDYRNGRWLVMADHLNAEYGYDPANKRLIQQGPGVTGVMK